MKKKKRLKSLNDIRQFLSAIINELYQERIDENRAKSFGYLCNILSGIVKDSDIESRLEALEEKLNGSNKNDI